VALPGELCGIPRGATGREFFHNVADADAGRLQFFAEEGAAFPGGVARPGLKSSPPEK